MRGLMKEKVEPSQKLRWSQWKARDHKNTWEEDIIKGIKKKEIGL